MDTASPLNIFYQKEGVGIKCFWYYFSPSAVILSKMLAKGIILEWIVNLR